MKQITNTLAILLRPWCRSRRLRLTPKPTSQWSANSMLGRV
ncbi:hypothetical protein [Polaromonas sp.]|nr:hypothetical protein [Polaromonas sp.]